MRSGKNGFMVGILLLLVFLITGVSHAAPDMSQWEGKWFSYTLTMKGVSIDFDGSSIKKGSSKDAGFFKISDWDGEYFQLDTYRSYNGSWILETQTFQFLAGNNLTFLFLVQNESDGFVMAALMQGKQKNGILNSAAITTYGGLIIEDDDNSVGAGSLFLKAKMVSDSKVPSNLIQNY